MDSSARWSQRKITFPSPGITFKRGGVGGVGKIYRSRIPLGITSSVESVPR